MKRIYKITPVSLYNIQGLERWLEEMANEGLFPIRVNGDFAQFRRGDTIPGTRFRLEAANGREYPEWERLELYQQSGWSYIGMVGIAYFLFYTTDLEAPELHTDPITRGMSLDWLSGQVRRARIRSRICRLLILGLLLAGIGLVWGRMPRRVPLLLLDLAGSSLIFLLWFLWLWWRDEGETRLLLDLQRSLKLGISPAPKHDLSNWLFWPLTAVTLLALVGGKFYERPISLEHFSRSYVNLQQLESESLFTYEELFHESPGSFRGSNWGKNIVTRQFSFLSPNYYTVEQTLLSAEAGEMENAYSPSGGPEYRYTPSLEATYLHLTIPPLARTVALSQLAQLELVNLNWYYEELGCSDLDFAILARAEHDPEWQLAAVCKGGHITVLRYAGREDLADHLDVLAAAVQ